jgi:hypothetical protein
MAHKGNLGVPMYRLAPNLHEKSDPRPDPRQLRNLPFHSRLTLSFQRERTFL